MAKQKWKDGDEAERARTLSVESDQPRAMIWLQLFRLFEHLPSIRFSNSFGVPDLGPRHKNTERRKL